MNLLKEFFFYNQLKQLQVAKETGIDPALLSKVINGWVKLPGKHSAKLAKCLGISEEELKTKLKGNDRPQRGSK